MRAEGEEDDSNGMSEATLRSTFLCGSVVSLVGKMVMDVVSVGPCVIKPSEVVTTLLLSTSIGGVWREDSAVRVTSGKLWSDICSTKCMCL
jgi:hypothetical protein